LRTIGTLRRRAQGMAECQSGRRLNQSFGLQRTYDARQCVIPGVRNCPKSLEIFAAGISPRVSVIGLAGQRLSKPELTDFSSYRQATSQEIDEDPDPRGEQS
jgi:hypothetical protein